MSVISVSFFAFFLLTLIVYYLIPKRFQWMALLTFSLCFFVLAVRSPWVIVYLAAGVLCTWVSGKWIEKAAQNQSQGHARIALILGMAADLGILAVLKYNGFFLRIVDSILNRPFEPLGLLAPLGISFYTFTLVGYLLDVYWGKTQAQESLTKMALFTVYYPALTSGPILRYPETGGQLFGEHSFDYQIVVFGMERMLWGLFKKLVISARIGIAVDTIYSDLAKYSGLFIWMAAALFMLQLYTDFSGCMDIILGASACYGIMLPENFHSPFFSRSVQEFWQRWHITLGGWMRDYVLFSVLRSRFIKKITKWMKNHWGKKAAKQIPSYLGMLCVWLLMGLWHGGEWKYILGQGIWFWMCIVLARALEPVNKKLIAVFSINTDCFSWHLFQSIRVYILVCIGNMFFRLNSIREVFTAIKFGLRFNITGFVTQVVSVFGGKINLIVIGVGLLLVLMVSVMQEKKDVRQRLAEQNLIFRWTVLIALIFSIVLAGMYGPEYVAQDFIYEHF